MKQTFKAYNPRAAARLQIEQANIIITEYQRQGFILTIRQLYYQFVARDLLANTERNYQNLITTMSRARLAGMIDWNAVEDRTRNLETELHLRDPQHGLELLRDQWYGIDMWENQEYRVEVWIEKEALVGVIARTCADLDVPYFACRGYVSQSEQYKAGMRAVRNYVEGGQQTIILHLGDHDPSGIDMTRDNYERLEMFAGEYSAPVMKRIALNMDQVDEYGPPPNPAKFKDPRADDYIAKFGRVSWELDALEPTVMTALIEIHIDQYRDPDLWQEKEDQLDADRQQLSDFIDQLD